MIILLAVLAQAAATTPSRPDLGIAEGRCRTPESGSAFFVQVEGLKDRRGMLKLELYPGNSVDFLADDNVLVSAGKAFRRVETALPPSGPVELCIRAPGSGSYALTLLHDRDGNRKFGLSSDGVGFSQNPKLGWSKPKAPAVTTYVGAVPIRLRIVLNYRRGLTSFQPIAK